MAPEVALAQIERLTKRGDVVLDPMCGSGTVLQAAIEQGRAALGADLDPLAVIIARTTCKPDWAANLEARAEEVVRAAKRRSPAFPTWIADDPATADFVKYWFGPKQLPALARIARVLADRPRRDDALRLALSRLIVTKESAASLARDTAHSRPHRVKLTNDFDVFSEYTRAARSLEQAAVGAAYLCAASVRRADARHLSHVNDASVDLVVTSPPYLNAIDYLRAHRMTLVWLGWTLTELRDLRGMTIGAERGLAVPSDELAGLASAAVPRHSELSSRHHGMVLRFIRDIGQLCSSLQRVIKPGGHAVLIVADSQLGGVPIENSAVCMLAAQAHGFELADRQLREIPAHHRYLPPPTHAGSALSRRMREESILTFHRSRA
jgi:DNA modification methylase